MGRLPALEGAALYESLYQHGYHNASQHPSTKGAELLLHLRWLREEPRFRPQLSSLLDVGCSHGLLVQMMWDVDFKANGVDISQTAVEMARTHHKHSSKMRPRCVGECFQQASATALPFANSSFDAIISSDVLEHLTRDDTTVAVREFARIARHFLLLKIAASGEHIKVAHLVASEAARQNASVPAQLHLTVGGPEYWVPRIAREGFQLHYQIASAKWRCCSYVFRRASRAEYPERPPGPWVRNSTPWGPKVLSAHIPAGAAPISDRISFRRPPILGR